MLLGTLPSRYSRFPFYMIDVDWRNQVREDGQAVSVPNGLRVVESLLAENFRLTTSPFVIPISSNYSSA